VSFAVTGNQSPETSTQKNREPESSLDHRAVCIVGDVTPPLPVRAARA
jgi:hypothetical protein